MAKAIKMCKKKKNLLTPSMEDMMKEFSGMNEDPTNVVNADIILDKFINYRKLIKIFLTDIVSINVMFKNNNIKVKYLSPIVADLFSTYKHFSNCDLNGLESCISIGHRPKEELIRLKTIYYDLLHTNIISRILKISTNIGKSKIIKYSLAEYKDRVSQKLEALYLLNGVECTAKDSGIENIAECILTLPDTSSTILYEKLRNIFTTCKEIHTVYMRPEVNTRVIFDGIKGMLSDMKKDVRGCDLGFDFIENASGIFDKNFNSYFRDAKKVENPLVIVRSFMDDIVSEASNNSEDVSIKQLNEIKQLSTYFKKIMATKMKQFSGKMPDNIKSIINNLDSFFDDFAEMDMNDVDSGDQVEKRFNQFKEQFGIE